MAEPAPSGEGLPALGSGGDTIPPGVLAIRAPEAWLCGQGAGICVAVLDTGIDESHPDLEPRIAGSVNYVAGEGPEDGNGHGTAVAGLIGASKDGAGIVGVAPACSIFNVKVLDKHGAGTIDAVVSGLNWCVTQSLHIAVMTFGGPDHPDIREACRAAADAGLLLVGPPGAYPGDYPFVMSAAQYPLGASNPEGEFCADGRSTWTTLPGGQYGQVAPRTAALGLVAGAIALAFGTHRFADSATIRRLMAATGNEVGVRPMSKVDALKASMEFRLPP